MKRTQKAGRRWATRDLVTYAVMIGAYVVTRLPFYRRFDLVSFDGTFYLNQAKAFFSGLPPTSSFPIGYPFFVALLIPFVGDAVRAGRFVSFAAGLGSVFVLYLLARRFLRRDLALGAALVLCITPLFVRLTLTTFSESLYMFFVLLALLLYSKDRFLACGVSLGAAAITRPEALAIIGFLILLRLRKPRALSLLAVGFVIVYSLNVTAFYAWFGEIELLPKKEFIGASTADTWQSMEHRVAPAWETDMREMLGSEKDPRAVTVEFFRRMPSTAWLLFRNVAFIAVLLAVLGAVTRPSFVLVALIPLLAIPIFTVRDSVRYLLPYVPIVILFGFIGVDQLTRVGWRRVALVSLIASAAAGVFINRDQLLSPVDEGHFDLKQAGLALRGRVARGSRIADRKPYLPFYADCAYVEIPANSYDQIIRYLVAADVDYLSLHEGVIRQFRPMLWPLASSPEVIRGENRFDQFSRIGDYVLVYKRNRDAKPLDWFPVTDDPMDAASFPAWAPDGERIAYVSTRSGNADIRIVSISEGLSQVIVDGPDDDVAPSWSPDGQNIVFASNRSGSSDLFVVDVANGSIERLFDKAGVRASPSWSADGTEIVFVSIDAKGQHLAIKDLPSGRVRVVPSSEGANFPVFSPDARRIAWVRHPGALVIYERATGGSLVVANPRNTNYKPAWSPDGKLLAVTAKDWGSVDVYLVTADGEHALLLTKQPGFDGQPAWAADGRIAVASNRRESRGIWILSGIDVFIPRLTTPAEVWTLKEYTGGKPSPQQ